MPSPSQPRAALSPSELAACVSMISDTSWAAHPSGGPIVLTYSTGVPEQWLLGLSAAAHGLPLVLVGLGRRGWSWWSPVGKLPGTARALQLMHALTPSAPIVFADGGDTVVANRWTRAEVESAMSCGGILSRCSNSATDHVITGGECNSWPLCYNESYLRDPSYRRCLAGSAACYPNSGTYLGRPAALLGFVDGLKSTLRRMDARGYAGRLEAEKGNDQALLHRFYLHRARHAAASALSQPQPQPQSLPQPLSPAFSLCIDGEAALFLSLFPCSGYHHYKQRGNGPFEYCHEKPFDPMRRLQSTGNGTGLVLRSTDVASSRSTGETPHDRRPLLLHANGKHYRLHERPLAPLLSWLLSPSAAERARIESHPVLLIDSVPLGTCGVASFGSVMKGWQKRTVVL